jgi:hypothetical protein
MATLAYAPHLDAFGRQPSHLNRRSSMHSVYGGQPHIPFPYGDQHAGMYPDRPISTGLHGEVCGVSFCFDLVACLRLPSYQDLCRPNISDLWPT